MERCESTPGISRRKFLYALGGMTGLILSGSQPKPSSRFSTLKLDAIKVSYNEQNSPAPGYDIADSLGFFTSERLKVEADGAPGAILRVAAGQTDVLLLSPGSSIGFNLSEAAVGNDLVSIVGLEDIGYSIVSAVSPEDITSVVSGPTRSEPTWMTPLYLSKLLSYEKVRQLLGHPPLDNSAPLARLLKLHAYSLDHSQPVGYDTTMVLTAFYNEFRESHPETLLKDLTENQIDNHVNQLMVIARRKRVEEYEEVLSRFCQAMVKATQTAKDNPDLVKKVLSNPQNSLPEDFIGSLSSQYNSAVNRPINYRPSGLTFQVFSDTLIKCNPNVKNLSGWNPEKMAYPGIVDRIDLN